MIDTQMNELIRDIKALPTHAISYSINWWIKKRFPEFAILQTDDLELMAYAQYGHCVCTIDESISPEISTHWNADRSIAYDKVETALIDVSWNEHRFTALYVTWKEDWCSRNVTWLISDDRAVLDQFFATVSQWQPPTEPAVEVFQDGRWVSSRTLYKSIKSATFDNLILAPGQAEELRADLSHFFSSQEIYDRYGIPWKRGVLMSGPPGNGKTHTVKALINWLDKPALYVKSLKSKRETEHSLMNAVFSRARTVAPCVLVFEDLESIVTPLNRSYFLNELDGFALNTGIVVVATTNHPELLDPAITERPSRFDRKYNFDLPGANERARYLSAWNAKIEPDLQLTEDGINAVSADTDGFSFAFMKELVMASMMRWINRPEKPPMDDVMAGQVLVLRTQMANGVAPLPDLLVDTDGEDLEDDE